MSDGEGPPADEPTGRLGEALEARRDKLERLRARGVDPFALRFDPDTSLAALRERFGDIDAGSETDTSATVAGRIVLFRHHGKLSFATIRDGTDDVQLFLSRDSMGEDYALLDDLDLGDIVGAEGVVMKTRKGELSVKVRRLTLLTKALRPLPEKFHGLRDPEVRLRQRYLEFATSPEARTVLQARAAVLTAVRGVLTDRGFLEVETPVLQKTHGGALARPFVTHHRVLDADLYLRIAPELYLKRLLVGGIERVFEIGRNFRNEGVDRDHNPEFTMLEAYQAYGTYEDMMELYVEMSRAAALAVRGTLRFEYQGQPVDLEGEWPQITVAQAVSDAIGEEVSLDDTALPKLADRLGVSVHPGWGSGKILLELYEKLAEPHLFQPTFVVDFPREVSPLARPHRSTPGVTEQVDYLLGGMEIGPAYSELTDPDEQRARFEDQQRLKREAGDEEAHPLDEDFLRALEHGMPPAGGLGLGIDRLTMVLADIPNIREVIAFPLTRPEAD
ncbi:MAG TPA: lysine--tRNA ligase [Actinomycetota bacterium]|nr:lysine--tRNA ligase [Actinomycetota bacterium]